MGSGISTDTGGNPGTKDGTKRALLVGCNYPNTQAALAGCANDVSSWMELLTTHFGFDRANIKTLTDNGQSDGAPTGRTIKRELNRIVDTSKAGDVIFFQFSGHGVQIPADEDGDYEEDGLDEALCPTDLNLIVDDDLRAILTRLDSDVKFTMVSDCCHSGGMLDHDEIVISGKSTIDAAKLRVAKKMRGISVDEMKAEISELEKTRGKKNRSLDLATMTEMLKGATAADAEDSTKPETKIRGAVRRVLYELHGKDASHAALVKKARDLSPEETRQIFYSAPGKKPSTEDMIDPNKGILITGCQAHESSADVTGLDGRSFGALSHCIAKIITKQKNQYGNGANMSNYDLVLKVRRLLTKAGFEQNPCLECSAPNAQANFIVW